jgi:hypothetical protein
MLELLGLFAMLIVGGVLLGIFALAAVLLKVVLKIAFIPVVLGLSALKIILAILIGGVGLLILGPVVLGVGLLVLIPALILGGLVWAGMTLASTI